MQNVCNLCLSSAKHFQNAAGREKALKQASAGSFIGKMILFAFLVTPKPAYISNLTFGAVV